MMYHLLVSYNGWEISRDTLDTSRAFEYTSARLENIFKPQGNLDLSKITRIPALFASESGGKGIQIARIGNIDSVEILSKEVQIQYHFDPEIPPIPNSMLEQLANNLGIEGFELSRTHWAIKDINLFRVLLLYQPFTKITPKVFKLDETNVIADTLISVMMPFSRKFDQVYELLKSISEDLRLNCLRADDIWENDNIMQDVVSLIQRSRIVICDCTGRNPNVFYEAGIAHTLGKDVILITQNENDIPFDLRPLRYIHYLDNNEGREELAKKLKERIIIILNSE